MELDILLNSYAPSNSPWLVQVCNLNP